MKRLRALSSRLVARLSGRTPVRDVDAELNSHIDLHVADFMQAGLTEDEARRHSGGARRASSARRRCYEVIERHGLCYHVLQRVRQRAAIQLVLGIAAGVGFGLQSPSNVGPIDFAIASIRFRR